MIQYFTTIHRINFCGHKEDTMATNPIFEKFDGCNPGETCVSVLGMATEDFDSEAVDKVQKVIAKHNLQNKLIFLKNDYNYWLVDRDSIQPDELTETTNLLSRDDEDDAEKVLQVSRHQLLLNLDDESDFRTDDEIIPPEFMRDLLLTLAKIGEMEPDEYILALWRKGYMIDAEDNDSTWEDFKELLAL